jgi:murein DD-endopeptidase MepM/ murein hydrolase activator NlpD/beta-lactamase regulating signal transducer with metallopeptidase domain
MDFQMIFKLSGQFFSLFCDEIYYAGIVFFIVWILIFLLKKKSPHWHYALWFLVLLRLILPPDLSFSLSGRNLIFQSLVYEKIINIFDYFTHYPSLNVIELDTEFVSFGYEDQSALQTKTKLEAMKKPIADYFYLILFVSWVTGVMIFLPLYIKKLHRFHSIIKWAIVIDNTIINRICEDWRSFFRIKRPVSLVYSDEYLSPFTIGILKPIIYIPKKILELKNKNCLETIIGHEMSHIKRYDNLWMKFQSLLQIIYFFNPIVWHVNSKINLSRECICDQMVLSKKNISAVTYGNGILAVLKMNLIGADEINVLPGFGSQRKKLIYRVNNLTGENNMGKFQSKIIYATLILLGLFLLPMAETIVEKESPGNDNLLYAEDIQQEGKINQDTVTVIKVVKKGNSYTEIPVDPKDVEISKLIVFKNLSFVLPIKFGRVTSGFGNMKHPFTKKIVHHNGIDIAAYKGTEIYAAADGKIAVAVTDEEKKKGPGKHILVQHAEDCETFYSHLDEVLVKEGQDIKAGEVIGKVGETGMSTGTHLHFEIRYKNEAQDPKNYLDFKKLIKKIEKIKKINANQTKTEIKKDGKTKLVYPVKLGRITSAFGTRIHPHTKKKDFHSGIDIAAKKGTNVLAADDGIVISVVNKYSDNKGPGRNIVIDHKNGYQTFYACLDSIIAINEQEVEAGQIIGYVGNTGRAAGYHLHFEVRSNGEPLDPFKHIQFSRK